MSKKRKPKKAEPQVRFVPPPHWQQVLGALQQIQKQRESRIIDPKNQGQKTLPLPVEAILMCLAELMEAVQVHTYLLGALGKNGSVLDFRKEFKEHYRPLNPTQTPPKEEPAPHLKPLEVKDDEQSVSDAEE